MKITSLFCLIFISLSSAFAQEIDERLLSKYSQQELETMISTNPDQYNLLDYALDNAIYVANYSDSKSDDLMVINVDLNALPNFIELNLEVTNSNQYFRIEGEEKLLVVKSTSVLNYEMGKR